MADRPKKKTPGVRNDARKNGKAWKQGKAPEVREAEAKQARKVKETFAADRETS